MIFVGWAWGADRVRRNVLNYGSDIEFGPWWNVMVKFVAPGLIIFASYGFFKAWLLPSVPAPIAWSIIISIVVLNVFIFYTAIRHPVPLDIGDMPTDRKNGKNGAFNNYHKPI
ncbi:hypothetical protein [Dehalobacterium formicoaceticum]|uniref:Uncharacterized protein n=1 Tax=Dehalobacterium formicoaceticum TaxID=51515 RepID=A0ABT1Y624_9FIRM|nr:hypothetical protein [Dehalobacterium formicoaceticum]MCR6546312.1 hypothetical protein [Dehalobacterium formicoaceticum]